jgi:hypothetical protein
MVPAERIQQYIQRLPASSQIEALDFVEYLLTKAERETSDLVQQKGREWSGLSLALAMRGMEDEPVPLYNASDLQVVFS